jgi:endoglucanase
MQTRLLVLLALPALAACGDGPAAPGGGPPPQSATALQVVGNRLVDSSGQTVLLRGVDRSGTEYACAQGWGFFDGPSDSASVAAIASWNANAVRVPLNETCWLAINGVAAAYAGSAYHQAITDYVGRLNRAGLYVILDLHWAAAGSGIALGQVPMADRDHSPEFWRQVAATFKGNNRVIFDLFNEPYPDNNSDTPEAWRCWLDGGTCQGMSYQAAGMQELVDAVRGTGATNVIMLGGVEYSAGLSGWLAHKPADPLNSLVASWHVYQFSWCASQACWDSTAAPVSLQVPLVLGELGQDDGGTAFVNTLMDWMDARGGGYLAWDWDVWGSPLDVISNYDGTPTPYGQTFRSRFSR